MEISFFGVRGSLPTPGPTTVRFGGNTSCVCLDLDDEAVLVLDAGSGIAGLGLTLAQSEKDITLILTHMHWDHHQGFPFFRPLYQAGRRIDILLPEAEWVSKLTDTLDGDHYFPMPFEELPSNVQFVTENLDTALAARGVSISRLRTNHPGLCFGYRIEKDGGSVVYLPDNELGSSEHSGFQDFVEFCSNANVLIHDGQYTAADMPAKEGWGHSVVNDTCRLAHEAGVGRLFLFHHDPLRTDDELEALQTQAQSCLKGLGSRTTCLAAAEGTHFEVDGPEGD